MPGEPQGLTQSHWRIQSTRPYGLTSQVAGAEALLKGNRSVAALVGY